MTVLTTIEIATNYPDNILIHAVESKEDPGKWSSLMYMTRDDGEIHKLMLSFDNAPFDSKEEAIEKMEGLAQEAIEYVKNEHGE